MKMATIIKKTVTLLAAICLILSPAAVLADVAQPQASPVTILVNEQTLACDAAPFIAGGLTYVPLRSVLEALDAEVSWDQERKEITARTDTALLVMKVGSETAAVNNRVLKMPAAPVLIEKTTYVPVRFIGETFGAQVNWNAQERQVMILTAEAEKSAEAESVLTYAEAVKTGMKNNSTYNNAVLSAEKASQKNDDLYVSPGTTSNTILQAKQQLSVADRWGEMNLEIVRQQIDLSIRNQMDALSLMLLGETNSKQKISFLKYRNGLEKLKYESGLTSLLTYQDKVTELDKEEASLRALQKEIEGAWIALNTALGYPTEQRSTLEYQLIFEPIGEVDLDRKFKDDAANDPYIWMAEQGVDLAELSVNLYEFNAGQSWTLTRLDLTQAKEDLGNQKKSLKETIQSRYNQLKQIEENAAALEVQKEQAKRQVNTARLQYDLGMITKAELEEALLAEPQLQYQLESLYQKHSQLKAIFEKPYLSPSYVSGSGGSGEK